MGQLASIEPTWHLFRCSSQCDPGGEGCIASGTVTKEYGAITCSATDDKATVGAKHGDLRRGGGFEGYVMSTEVEQRALESRGEFLKAEGSRGWRGVV